MLRVLRSIVTHRRVLSSLIVRDLKVKYRGSLLGYLWSLAEPLALAGIYWFLYTVLTTRQEPNYPLLALVGVLAWSCFAAIVQSGANSLVANSGLIRKIYIPREIFVFSLAGYHLVVFGLSLLAVIPFAIYYRSYPGVQVMLFLPAVVMTVCLASGLALVASCLNARYRDVTPLVGLLLRLMFYASPVIYPLQLIPDRFLNMYLMNPMAVAISMFRSALLGAPFEISYGHVAASFTTCLLVFVAGAFAFDRLESEAVKYL